MMGIADMVPGVSGGTIALVLGFYERLVASIKAGSSALGSFARLEGSAAFEWLLRIEWRFLLPLLTGIGLAVVTLSKLLKIQLEEHPIEIAALFLGLILSSIIVAWRLIENRDLTRLMVMLAVGAVLFVFIGLRDGTSDAGVHQAADPAVWMFFLSGSAAICAMILPGISGSLVLVMLGMYRPILDSVTDRELDSLSVFLAGAVIGLALFSQLLYRLLDRHRDTVIAGLIGLMIGSTRVLWPWPDGIDSTSLGTPADSIATAASLTAFGFVIILVIERIIRLREQ